MCLIVETFARHEAIVSGKVLEEAVVVGALSILEALKVNLPRLLFLGVVDTFARFGKISGVD